ncbi:hypothetical protein E2C01_039915 [Portunus trituberculatus]|uniref:Uncharacterized protein n=1 Tax=Portunus trituberculatus TaxID=210409 RepID=A0A5B7FI87_PORTR|nr:hypothetical protein [Portunus trituberculatus]
MPARESTSRHTMYILTSSTRDEPRVSPRHWLSCDARGCELECGADIPVHLQPR